jgi:solute carrier family 13 (sodium-dependent dicarboxylate transporter), member 2/3/5
MTNNTCVSEVSPLADTALPTRAHAFLGQAKRWFARMKTSRIAWAVLLALLSGAGLVFGLDELSTQGKVALMVFALAVIAWSVLRLDETPVAIAGGLALIVFKGITPEDFYSGMGDDLIWLMIASFMLAAVLRQSGVAERYVMRALCGKTDVVTLGVRQLFTRLTWLIAATAFVIPSTSGRAAMLLPLYLVVAQVLPQASMKRALALLFPTVILLSACASMLGAGAHLVAADIMATMQLQTLGFAHWALLGIPFAVASCFGAMHLILQLFVSEAERSDVVLLQAPDQAPLTQQQKNVLGILLATMALWVVGGFVGLQAAVVALAAALLATTKALTGVSIKEALKAVEWNLILFLAATMVMGEALLVSGAAQMLAERARALLPVAWANQSVALVLVVSLISLLSHCVITSRTARAMVLIPTIALPLAASGMNATALIFISVVASGFCQTFSVSAKPVTLFASKTDQAFNEADLMRLSLWLLPMMLALLMLFAFVVWPLLGLSVGSAAAAAVCTL